MKAWRRDQPSKFEAAEETEIEPFGRGGGPRNRVTIRIVRLGDDLYIRPAYGPGFACFRESKRLSDSCGANPCVAFMNACSPSSPLKANRSIRVCRVRAGHVAQPPYADLL